MPNKHASVLMNFSDKEVRNELKKRLFKVITAVRNFFQNDELGKRMTEHFMASRLLRKKIFQRLVQNFAKYMKEIDVE